jgi:hypothetical protein
MSADKGACGSKKCGEFNDLACYRVAGHDGDHWYGLAPAAEEGGGGMSCNCKHGIEEAFHCFDCEYAFKRTGKLHDEFKTWEFSWSKIHGRSPCAEDGWLADKYRGEEARMPFKGFGADAICPGGCQCERCTGLL